jgi:cardiolipin synthase
LGEAWSWLGKLTAGALPWSILAFELLALCTVPSVLLRRRGRPTAALAWLFALFALPALGSLAWWAVGRTNLERKRRRRAKKKRSFAEKRKVPDSGKDTIFARQMPKRAHGDCVFASHGNQVELLLDGPNAYPALEAALSHAKRSIHIEYYIWEDDATGRRLRDLLVERAQAGVAVRVLVDGFGTRNSRWLAEPLRAAGAKVGIFLPSHFTPFRAPRFNFVNHRKVVVVDGEVAFTGGMNIGSAYATSWRDAMLRLRGPAVMALDHVFLDDWYFATDELLDDERTPRPLDGGVEVAVVASGPDSEAWIHDAYFISLTQATQRIWIATPYFIPGPAILAALRTAAGRGVDVRILVPSTSDVTIVKWASRSYYRELIEAGVHIFEYHGMVHAKALVTDDHIACVGTANIDSRSFRLSFEVGCFLASRELNAQLSSWHESLVKDSAAVTRLALQEKPTLQKLAESAAHLLSPLL